MTTTHRQTAPKIVTSRVFPPIPLRQCDWCAHDENYDGAEDAGPQIVGWGRTEAEAVADYLQLVEDNS